jgi:predicted nuclease with TOPRIM domain
MDVQEEIVNIQTIQILLNDKMHKFEEIMTRLETRINELGEEINK